MRVVKGTIYRISVEADCGCSSAKEFTDISFKEAVGTGIPVYTPCEEHGATGAKTAAKLIENLLLQFIEKEAERASKTQVLPSSTIPTVQADGSEVSRIPMQRPVQTRERSTNPLEIKRRTRPGPVPASVELAERRRAAQTMAGGEIDNMLNE